MFKGSIWEVLEGGTPNCVKMFASEVSTDIKNKDMVSLVVQKLDFWGSPRGMVPPNYVKVFVS